MKRSLLILCSAAAAFVPAIRRHLSTANGAAEDILAKLGIAADAPADVIEAVRLKLIDEANPAAVTANDPLGLGVLQLPTGLDKKDVLWRKRAGLSTKQAVQAALAQKRHDDALPKAKVEKEKTPAVPGSALAASLPKVADMTIAQLTAYATEKKIDLGKATAKADLVAAVEAFNKNLAKEERDAA